uniref:SGF29 C-terminal domain-containing protein n=1 Tax=Spermophilus dauricus TaxID=99837 RepID=A0A8C9PHA1_SPEDA
MIPLPTSSTDETLPLPPQWIPPPTHSSLLLSVPTPGPTRPSYQLTQSSNTLRKMLLPGALRVCLHPIAVKIPGSVHDLESPWKTMCRGVLITSLQPLSGDKLLPFTGSYSMLDTPASGDYVVKYGDKVATWVKAEGGDEQWILAEMVNYNDLMKKAKSETHTLSNRCIIPQPQWKAIPEKDPEALSRGPAPVVLHIWTTCFSSALIHTALDENSILFEDTSYADGCSPPLSVTQRYVVAYRKSKNKGSCLGD